MDLAREYLYVSEAAYMLGFMEDSIYRFIREGKLEAIRRGRRILVKRTSVEAMRESRAGNATPTVSQVSQAGDIGRGDYRLRASPARGIILPADRFSRG